MGLLSGLAGIGGGAIMVPFLYALLESPDFLGVGVAPAQQAVVAHATSLLVIVPTAVSGLRTFHRAGLVAWSLVLPMAVASVAAAAGGAVVAGQLPPGALKTGFGLVLLATGARMAWQGWSSRETGVAGRGESLPDRRDPAAGISLGTSLLCGAAVGLFSALMGVGGGLLAIPLLIYVLRVPMEQVAATSMGLIVFASVAGSVAYVIAGFRAPALPPGTLGFVFVPAALALAPGAVLGARWGARLNQRLDPRGLTWLFAVLFLVLGARLVASYLAPLR